jgi:hypothetical protein
VTRWQFDKVAKAVWAHSHLTLDQVKAGLFAQLLAERRAQARSVSRFHGV